MKILNSKGYVALTTVVVILAVILILLATMTYSVIGEAQSGLALLQGEDNLYEAEGCVEDAMLKARSNSAFGDPVGTPVNITRPSPEPTCVVTVISKTGSGTVTWDMNVTLNTTNYKRTLNIDFTRAPTGITLTSWREI